MHSVNQYHHAFVYNNQKIVVETNKIASQTERSFVIKWNNSVVLVTLGVSNTSKDTNFLPLTVDFKENFYSIGKIPGGFFRREGKPSEYAVLSARIIDRSIRNFFPKDFRNEVQIIINPLAVDYSIDLRVVAVLGTSLALNTSSLPFNQALAAVHVGLIADKIVFNPDAEQSRVSDLNMFIVGNETQISMIEIDANQISETRLMQIIRATHKEIQKIIAIQKTVNQMIPRKTTQFELFQIDPAINNLVREKVAPELDRIIAIGNQHQEQEIRLQKLIKTLKTDLKSVYDARFATELTLIEWNNQVDQSINQLLKSKVRHYTIQNQHRIDQRKFDELRSINCEIDYLPIVHGSAVFNRGQTQTLSVVTLRPVSEQQIIDNLTKEENKNFMHHYNSAPFAIGGVSPMRGVSRREIGHGFLGEKALKKILPTTDSFPYTIRIVTEVLQSNGSTSQAAICSAVLALLAAGVPVKDNLAGVAIGLIKESNSDNYHILTDIQAWEDFYGDMDFKVAGGTQGICAIQLDLKIPGLPIEVIAKILEKARQARFKILAQMAKVIHKPRSELAPNTLKFAKLKIEPENISTLIGPSGKNIKKIIKSTGDADINIQEDGEVLIYHQDQKMLNKARKIINELFQKVEINKTYHGFVTKITDFGAFIQLEDRLEIGLIHVSKIAKTFVKDITNFVQVNDKVLVKVINVDLQQNRISLELLKNLSKNNS